MTPELQQKIINTIRFLAVDAVEKANSGHPGMPMGCAPIAFVLWSRHLRFNPREPRWPTQEPMGSMPSWVEMTAILEREPASRATAFISTEPL